MPIGDYPILEVILRQLKAYGVDEVVLAVGHMSQLFQAFFGDGARLGLSISYSFEDRPLGTAGPIALALDRLGEDFIVMNGDLLTTLDYAELFASHVESKAAATIAIYTREVNIDFGVLELDSERRLSRYIEKPTYKFDVSMGVNVFNARQVREYLRPGERLDIPDLMSAMHARGALVKCHRPSCYWLDIGRLDDYHVATEVFDSRRSEFLPVSPESVKGR